MTLHSNQNVTVEKLSKDSQHYTIINYLMTKGKNLTVWTATTRLKIYALSQRIGELKRMGFPIKDRWIETEEGKHCKEYFLSK